MSEHTPTPWATERHDQEDGSITYEIWNYSPEHYRRILSLGDECTGEGVNDQHALANAAFIVRACNCFDDLVKALEATEALDNDRDDCEECYGEGERESCGNCFPAADDARLKRRAALAKARGEA